MLDTATVPRQVYEELRAEYGPQYWWPAQSKFEVMVGAVLTQNTAWKNVEQALGNLTASAALSPEKILALSPHHLGGLLRPSGYYNLKSRRLRALCQWLLDNGGYATLSRLHTDVLRESLLDVHGVGPETADAILLYAFERPVFVVDDYCRRIFIRMGVLVGKEPYEIIRKQFESNLSFSTVDYNEFHALIVAHAKRVCSKIPRCAACSVRRQCQFAISHIGQVNQ